MMNSNEKPNKILTYGMYAIMALLTLIMLAAGVTKLLGNEMLAQQFVNFGYPTWFFYLTGIIEIAAAILLWPRQTRQIGGLLILVTMIGALYSNITVGASQFYIVNSVIGLLGLAVAWVNRNAFPLKLAFNK